MQREARNVHVGAPAVGAHCSHTINIFILRDLLEASAKRGARGHETLDGLSSCAKDPLLVLLGVNGHTHPLHMDCGKIMASIKLLQWSI